MGYMKYKQFLGVIVLLCTMTYPANITLKRFMLGNPIPSSGTSTVYFPCPEYRFYRDSCQYTDSKSHMYLEYGYVRRSKNIFDTTVDYEKDNMGDLSLYGLKQYGPIYFMYETRTFFDKTDNFENTDTAIEFAKNFKDYQNTHAALAESTGI